jgi:hypothetical protein
MGSKIPWPIFAYERPWHDHLEMTKLIGPTLAKFGAPSKVMSLGKER